MAPLHNAGKREIDDAYPSRLGDNATLWHVPDAGYTKQRGGLHCNGSRGLATFDERVTRATRCVPKGRPACETV